MRFADGPPRWLLVVLLLLFVIRFTTSPVLLGIAVFVLLWLATSAVAAHVSRKRRN